MQKRNGVYTSVLELKKKKKPISSSFWHSQRASKMKAKFQNKITQIFFFGRKITPLCKYIYTYLLRIWELQDASALSIQKMYIDTDETFQHRIEIFFCILLLLLKIDFKYFYVKTIIFYINKIRGVLSFALNKMWKPQIIMSTKNVIYTISISKSLWCVIQMSKVL